MPYLLLIALFLGIPQVSGSVRSTDGLPVPAARVVVVGASTPASTSVDAAVTDAAGTFTLAGVELPVSIEVRAPGFATVRIRVLATPIEVVLAPAAVAESVVVAADRGDLGVWRDPATGRTDLRREDLEHVPAVTLDESLRVLSGFSLFRRSTSRSANPTTHGVTMRGLSASGASRGVVLLDGVPLNDGFGGWVTWTRLPAAAVSRVEVDRGLHGDVFGSDAVGGVVRVVTPLVSDEVSRHVLGAAEAGSDGVGAADASGGFQNARVSLFGATSWFRTDGQIPVEPEARGTVDRPTDAMWANGFGRVGVLRDSRRLTVSGWGGRDERGNGTVLQRNTMSGGAVSAVFDAAGRQTSFAARLSYSPNTFRQTFTAVAASRNSEFLTNTQRTETGVARFIVEAGRALPDGFVLVRGTVNRASADFEQVRSTSSSLDSVRDDSESISVQASVAPAGVAGQRLTLSGGARAEWRAAPADTDGRDTAFVGQAGVSLRVDDGLWIRGVAASSHRWPTLNELIRGFRVGDVTTLANPDLEPERSRSVEGAVVMDRGRALVSFGAFHTRVNDAVANVTLPSLVGILRERRNAGQVRATGLELEVEVRQSSVLRVRGALALTRSTFAESDEPGLTGNRVPQVPRASGSLWADAMLPRDVIASVVWRSSSTQFDDDQNTFELAAANQVDARVAGRVGSLDWRISVENLFDQRIEVGRTPVVTLAPGRSARLGVSVSLGRR